LSGHTMTILQEVAVVGAVGMTLVTAAV